MRGAARDKEVLFQQPAGTQDDDGWVEEATWVTVCTRQVAIVPLRGAERIAAKQVEAEVDTRIEALFDDTLATALPTWRVKFVDPVIGNRFFYLTDAINIRERGREMHFLTRERIDQRGQNV